VLKSLLKNDDTTQNRHEVSRTLSEEIVGMALEESSISVVQDKLIEGKDVVELSNSFIQAHVRHLIELIMQEDDYTVENNSPTPFSDAIKKWAKTLLGGWAHLLASCYTDGITSVITIVRTSVNTKLSSIGQFAFLLPIFSPMIGVIVQREYQLFKQNLLFEQKEWIQYIDENEKSEWLRIINEDEIIQKKMKENSEHWIFGESNLSSEEKKKLLSLSRVSKRKTTIQRPFSLAYRSGSGLKGKKTVKNEKMQNNRKTSTKTKENSGIINTTSYHLTKTLSSDLQSAINIFEKKQRQYDSQENDSGISTQELLKLLDKSNLSDLYKNQFVKDFKKRLEFDNDYNPKQFPVCAKLSGTTEKCP